MAQIDDVRAKFAAGNWGDECWLWGGSQGGSGYGRVRLGGRKAPREYVHRLACVEAHGPAPEGKPFAGHECGRSTCWNPNHVYWCTADENAQDKKMHGTYGRKLDEWQVLAIFDICSQPNCELTDGEVGKLFEVSRHTVSAIMTGKSWAHLELVRPRPVVDNHEDF